MMDLPYFSAGDRVGADRLNALRDAVARLEYACAGGGAAGRGAMRSRRQSIKRKGWMCCEATGDDGGVAISVDPGEVMMYVGHDEGGADCMASPDLDSMLVGVTADEGFVWLHADYSLSVQEDPQPQVHNMGLRTVPPRPEEVAWSLSFGMEAGGVHSRSWRLAYYNARDTQPLTQLMWGTLSLGEVVAVMDAQGMPLLPRAQSDDSWGSCASAVLLQKTVTNAAGGVMDLVLRGGMDAGGAIEFFLGPWSESTNYIWTSPGLLPEPDEWEGTPDDDYEPWVPGGGGGAGDDGDDVAFVPNGYVAGPGIASCQLMKNGRGQWAWKVELDGAALGSLLAGMSSKVTVNFTASGSQDGVYATVKMGLGACTLAGEGGAVTGSAEVVFEGTVGDASKTSDEVSARVQLAPTWNPEPQVWTIPASMVATGGKFMRVDPAGSADSDDVRALRWYRISVDVSRLKQVAQSQAGRAIAQRSVSGSDSSTSEDSTVTATLSGSMDDMTFDLMLS